MEGYGPETYGDRWAGVYDTWVTERLGGDSTEAAVERLAELAAGGRVLELAIGTGRIAVPLAERGLEVHGVDASEAMVAKLRDRPGGAAIPVTIGDFADVAVDGTFDLVFVVFNTFYALTTQERQIECFRNVARRLTAGGVFTIEAFMPNVARFDRGHTVRALRMTVDEVDVEASLHDPVTQTIQSQHIVIGREGTRLQPVHLRYAWPSELDLMARLAGLELRERWGGWDRSPFTASGEAHVSVYARRP